MSAGYFDWTTIEDDIVIPEQAAIAVYNNPDGGVVCRQAGQYGPDEDSSIWFHPSHALTLAKAILAKAGLDMAIVPVDAVDRGLRAGEDDATAANRSKRYRDRKRDERDAHRDAERDAERDTVTAPLLPEFDLRNGGPQTALTN